MNRSYVGSSFILQRSSLQGPRSVFSFLTHRQRFPELMDQPGLDASLHRQALRGLERINRWSGSARILWRPIRALAVAQAPQPLRVLDLATGGGDVPVRLALLARRAKLPIDFAGCDVSATAVDVARQRARRAGVAVSFFIRDLFAGELPDGYDVLTCSLFLHHLDENEAVELLWRMGRAASQIVLVNDLVRDLPGYTMAYVGTRVLSRSHIVHVDGPLSVRGAFTPGEALALAERAGLLGATIARRWPCRFLLTWRRP